MKYWDNFHFPNWKENNMAVDESVFSCPICSCEYGISGIKEPLIVNCPGRHVMCRECTHRVYIERADHTVQDTQCPYCRGIFTTGGCVVDIKLVEELRDHLRGPYFVQGNTRYRCTECSKPIFNTTEAEVCFGCAQDSLFKGVEAMMSNDVKMGVCCYECTRAHEERHHNKLPNAELLGKPMREVIFFNSAKRDEVLNEITAKTSDKYEPFDLMRSLKMTAQKCSSTELNSLKALVECELVRQFANQSLLVLGLEKYYGEWTKFIMGTFELLVIFLYEIDTSKKISVIFPIFLSIIRKLVGYQEIRQWILSEFREHLLVIVSAFKKADGRDPITEHSVTNFILLTDVMKFYPNDFQVYMNSRDLAIRWSQKAVDAAKNEFVDQVELLSKHISTMRVSTRIPIPPIVPKGASTVAPISRILSNPMPFVEEVEW